MEGEENKTTDNKAKDGNEETKQTGNVGEQQQTQQPPQSQIDTKKIKDDAVSEYLESLGLDDDALKGIVKKHKEEEDKNKTDLQKVQDLLDETTKKLASETKARIVAEAKVSAIKLGAKSELVDDLVTIASARVSKGKSIDEVIAEIKQGETGHVYFAGEEGERQEKQTKNLTGGMKKQTGGQRQAKQDSGEDELMKSLLAEKKKEKKRFYFKS